MAIRSVKDVLAAAGVLAAPNLFEHQVRAWRAARENGSGECLLTFLGREAGYSEDQTLQKLAPVIGWPYVDLPRNPPSAGAQKRVSTKVAFQYAVFPTRFENGVLQVAVSNPFDTAMLNAVRFDARVPGRSSRLAPRLEIEKALKKYYGVGAETLDEMAEDEPLELDVTGDKEITEGDQEASVIKFVNQVIWEAYKDRATDIHFEPPEDELRIRYRIDGILHQTPMPPQLKRFQAAIISRIKVMSGMNISEKRLPQDGRINVRIKGEEIDIRVSTVPDGLRRERFAAVAVARQDLSQPGQAGLLAAGRERPSAKSSSSRTGSCSSPARPARANPPRSTRSSARSTRSTSASSPSRSRSNTNSRASTRSRCARRSG